MATPNVIHSNAFGNSPTYRNDYLASTFRPDSIREPEGEYGADNITEVIDNLLNQPLWPPFPDGGYLKPYQAARFYRLAHGTQALTHILSRSAHSHALTQDYADTSAIAAQPLTPYQESQIWNALTELGADLVKLAEELQTQAEDIT
jgi:hypothetical protein